VAAPRFTLRAGSDAQRCLGVYASCVTKQRRGSVAGQQPGSGGEPYTATLLPGYYPGLSPWAVPKRTYAGTVAWRMVDLPTDGLGHVFGAPDQPTASSTAFLYPPAEYDAVLGATWSKYATGINTTNLRYRFLPLPHSVLHLHDGAFLNAEVYSSCTGVHRANFTLPRTFPAFAAKVEG
jgi:hypothetical protein